MIRCLILLGALVFPAYAVAQSPTPAPPVAPAPKKPPPKKIAPKPAKPAAAAAVEIPTDQDALQCAVPLFAHRLQIGPSVLDCSEYVRVDGATILDRSNDIGGMINVLVEVHLRSLQEFASSSIVASTCTGTNWQEDIGSNQGIEITTILVFQKFSRQAVCQTHALGNIVKGYQHN